MKNIINICKDFGLEIPADKHADFLKAVAGEYKTNAEYQKKIDSLTADMDAEKEARKTAEDTLKGFEGKDFDAITRERDEWKRKHEESEANHRREAEEREFNEILTAAITDSKGRNAKAIAAMLDLDKLRTSRNLDKDIRAALDSMRTEHSYLFEDNGGAPRFADPKGNGGNNGGKKTREEIMAIADRAERRREMARNQHLFLKEE